MKNKLVHRFIIGTFVSLYLLVSVISTIHVIDFFRLSNPYWLAVSLAVAFELGAAASLASLIILDKMNKGLVWVLFGAITLMQMQGNMYYAFVNMKDFQGWSELFGLIEEDVIYQKRVLAAVSGAILPLVALGFIKSLVDYIKPEETVQSESPSLVSEEAPIVEEEIKTQSPVKEELQEEKIEPSQDLVEEQIFEENENPQEVLAVEEFPSIEESPAVEEVIEEVSEDLNTPLAEEEISAIMDEPNPGDSVPGYYGDILIDGNGVTTEEGGILPVNANKKREAIDEGSKVYINPMRL